MALTQSKMMQIGTKAPSFCLKDANTDQMFSLEDLKSSIATVLIFMCNHCPYVKHIKPTLIKIAKQYQGQGISFVGINANDILDYPEDGPDKMKEEGYPFPYLFDKTQEVAKAYEATCTPDFFVFDKDLKCVYRGQFDDARPGNRVVVSGKDLTAALDALISGKHPTSHQFPSAGCSIKWKK